MLSKDKMRRMALYMKFFAFCIERDLGITAGDDMPQEDMKLLDWFGYSHLPDHLQEASKPFHQLAHQIAETVESGPERTVSLRKLLESKDAAVRAVVKPGG